MSEPQAMPSGDVIQASLRLALAGFELDVNLRLPAAGVSVLWGPSGCGKTTVLRTLAGLTRAHGRVVMPDEVWQDDARGVWLAPHRRALGYVFQEASLFAHLSVQGNLDFGRRRVPAQAQRVAWDEAVSLMGIGPLMGRSVQDLSGGERQRVAIARALLTSPRVLLMDEPLSALDAERKADILPYLERLSRQSGVPVIYVTHALDEAARLADHLVLMQAGRVLAAGPAAEMMSRLDLPMSRLDDAGAVLQATVVAHDTDYGQTQLQVAGWPVWVGRSPAAVGQSVRLRVAARDVSVALSQAVDSSILHILPCTVAAMRADGDDVVMLHLRLQPADGAGGGVGVGEGEGPLLLARVTRRSADKLALAVGMRVHAQLKGVALIA